MRNAEYWRRRMDRLMEAQMNRADTYGEDIEKAYRRAARSMQQDIEAWYAKFADNNEISMAQARKLLREGELEEFRWDVQEYIRRGKENGISADWEKQLVNASARVHISRLEALQLQCYQHIQEATGGLQEDMNELLRQIYSDSYYRTVYEIQLRTGEGASFAMLDTSRADKIISRPWAPDGSDFSKRIWTNREQLVQELHVELTQAIIRGDPPGKLAKQLAKRFEVSEKRAQALVQTESAFFATTAQRDAFKSLNVSEYEVVATLDGKTCAICGEMDGRHFKLSEQEPGVNAPPFHPRCRCCTAPVVDEEDDDASGQRVAKDENGKRYYVPQNMTFSEWKEKFTGNIP